MSNHKAGTQRMCYEDGDGFKCGYCQRPVKPRAGHRCACGAKVYIKTETFVRKTIMVCMPQKRAV